MGCTNGDVLLASNGGNPCVFEDGAFAPICVHFFWNNDDGAATLCRKLGFFDAPQVWLAAVLALAGVGLLELGGGDVSVGWGDVWSVLQAIGFGTSFYITERMMAKEPDQVLPITAAQCAVSALVAINQDFLGCLKATGSPRMDGEILIGLEAEVIPVVSIADGHTGIFRGET